jgi:uncharacterized protein YyaL (SSP411 family)
MQVQSENMQIYALAYQQWNNQDYLNTASQIDNFLINFLRSPGGAFYTS